MSSDRRLAWGLTAGGVVGFIAAAVLLVERIRLAQDSDYVPTCSLNPVLSCGSVMETAQASLLGFPNPIIGVAATIPLGVLFAIPAVRTRGINLAVVTLGLGTAMELMLFRNPEYTGGIQGTQVGDATLFGWNINSITHPTRYGLSTSMRRRRRGSFHAPAPIASLAPRLMRP